MYFHSSAARDFILFLLLVAVGGWAVIEGCIWLARFLFRHLAWVS